MFVFNKIGVRLPLLAGLLLVTSCTNTNQITNVVATQSQAAAPATNGAAAAPRPSPNPGILTVKRGVVAGTKQRIDRTIALNPDCSVIGLATVKVKVQPLHGTFTTEPYLDFPNFPKDNPRSACNTQRVNSLALYYAAEANYTGPDQVTLDLIAPNGEIRSYVYQITVE